LIGLFRPVVASARRRDNVCGPIDRDVEERKAKWDEFSEDFESAFIDTFLKHAPVFDLSPEEIFASDRPRFWQSGNRGNKNRRLKH
jgi:hypothetical protein